VPDATARDLGEFGLIARVVERLGTSEAVLVGPGDDAAVVAAPDGRVVATTDVLVEGVHFRRDWSTAYDVGRKAAAANLADVAAMGGTGTALLVGLAAPPDLPVAWATGLADGLRDESAVVGAVVVGGDTVASDRIVVSVTALGDLAGRAPVTRSGARPGELVVVAGRLGWSAAGLALLQAGGQRIDPLLQAHRRPAPPYALGPALAEAGATAMCDVSDGLLADLGHLARASGVRIDVESARFEWDGLLDEGARITGVPPLDFVLTGGEDHALVATVPPGTVLPPGVVRVGTVTGGAPGVRVLGRQPTRMSWQHFG
jgi:thiamine-monophosphate kinase